MHLHYVHTHYIRFNLQLWPGFRITVLHEADIPRAGSVVLPRRLYVRLWVHTSPDICFCRVRNVADCSHIKPPAARWVLGQSRPHFNFKCLVLQAMLSIFAGWGLNSYFTCSNWLPNWECAEDVKLKTNTTAWNSELNVHHRFFLTI